MKTGEHREGMNGRKGRKGKEIDKKEKGPKGQERETKKGGNAQLIENGRTCNNGRQS